MRTRLLLNKKSRRNETFDGASSWWVVVPSQHTPECGVNNKYVY